MNIGNWLVVMRLCLYNPLTACTAERAQEISTELGDHSVVVLPGTCRRGEPGGPGIFQTSYNDVLKDWNMELNRAHPPSMCLHTRCPFSGRMADLSITSYVDDIAKKHVAEDNKKDKTYHVAKAAEGSLTKKMAEIGVCLNPTKTEYHIGCFGPGCFRRRKNNLHTYRAQPKR